MKTKQTFLISSVAILATTLALSAEPDKQGKEGHKRHNRLPQNVVEKFDADGDGKLNKEERQTAKEARRKKILEKFDADGDGKLNKEERQAAREARRARMIKRFDTDGDGTLNGDERKAMRKEMRSRGKRKAKGLRKKKNAEK